MSNNAALSTFYGVFRGNTSFFVKHQAPFVKAEGKLKAKWCGFAEYNKRIAPPEGKEIGDLIPLTVEHYRAHLNGGDGLAISPLMNVEDRDGNIIKRNVCYFAAIDIDAYGGNFTGLVQRLYRYGYQFAAALSKSGGLHIYFFFREAESAEKVIEALTRIVEVFGLNRLYVSANKKSKVEVFPKQATLVPGKNANCLFLPYYNIAGTGNKKCPNKVLAADGSLLKFMDAMGLIDSMFTGVHEINAITNNLPYSGAPFCIQMALLTGAIGNNEGRNNLLFSAAVYLKKKYQDDFYDLLTEMNNCLDSPLEEDGIKSIYKSVMTKNYDGYKCRELPCVDYCDKKLCKQREYGVGRGKGSSVTGAKEWGELRKFDAGEGKAPYYEWDVKVSEEDTEYQVLHIDSHDDLLNLKAVQLCCLRDLNWIPATVKQVLWVNIVREALVGIKDRTINVPPAADTTEKAMLRESFMKFLTHKQIQKNGQPYMVKLGQVYHADGFYYFDTRGLLEFLRVDRFVFGRFNLNDWLVNTQGCEQDAELTYQTPKGEKKSIRCWRKEETPELLAMDVFYDDVYEADMDITEKSTLKNTGEESNGDDTRF